MQFKRPTQAQLKELVPDNTILLGYRGSIAHGLWESPDSEFSTDDIDLMGVAVAPIEHYFGNANFIGKRSTQERFIGEYDSVTYELRKFVGLLCNANPNVLALLRLEPHFYLKQTTTGKLLVTNKDLFATKKIFHSFTGYAYGQIHRMTHNTCEGYMGEKRKTLVDRFGYDCKNAAHAIRLLRMGIEFLHEGQLNVFREDRQSLLEIKHGEWTLDKVKEESDRLFRRAEDVYDRCSLPAEPDMDKVNELLVDILDRKFFGGQD